MRILVPALLVACGGGTGPATDGSTHTGTPPTFTLPGDLSLDDAADYAYDATWQLAASPIMANAEIYVSWDAKTTDAWGVDRSADSYGVLQLFELSVSRTDAVERLADDDLDAVTVATWGAPVAGETSARLSDLSGFDPEAQLAEDGSKSWLLALCDEAGPRLDVRDGVFLIPSGSQIGITLAIPNAGAATTWSVRFGNEDLRTDAGKDAYGIDWSALTVDGYGKPFDASRIDEVFVGRFDDVADPHELGDDVLELPSVAAGWWTTSPGGATSVSLSDATDSSGASFPGFTADATWLVGGRCTTCLGPAPTWLTIVDVRQP